MKPNSRARSVLIHLLVGCFGLGALLASRAAGQCPPGGPRAATGATFILSGRVVNASDNMDVPFVTLRLYGVNQRQMAVSDGQGRFLFNCLEPGMYTVEASKEGFQDAQVQFPLLSGSSSGNSDALIRLHPRTTTTTIPMGETLAARQARIPAKARSLFEKGVEELHKQKKPEASLAYFRQALEIFPEYDEAYVQLGTAQFRLSRPEEAEQTFRKGIQVYPQNARAHVFLGKLLAAQGKTELAIEELKRAIDLDNTAWMGYLDLARIFSKQGKAKEAFVHAARAHELNKEVEDTHLAYYNACVNLKDYAAGLAELDELVKLYPNSETAKKLQAIRPNLAKEITRSMP